jgi:AcrR family transcriptional regulator
MDVGRVDPHDEPAVAALVGRLRALRGMLEEHAAHEDRWVEPLLAELRADIAESLKVDHARIDSAIPSLETAFIRWEEAPEDERVAMGRMAYGALSSFVGAYLNHMAREEDEAMPVLQAAMTDEQLLQVSAQLRGAIPPPRMAQYVSIMLPAMNVEERTQMFAGLKANAPREVLDGMCELASGVLASSDWSAVRTRVGL